MQTKEELLAIITEMLSEVDDVRSLERVYHFIQYINAESGSIVKEIYKGRIIEILDEIEDQGILLKIYTVVKTHFAILKEKEQEN